MKHSKKVNQSEPGKFVRPPTFKHSKQTKVKISKNVPSLKQIKQHKKPSKFEQEKQQNVNQNEQLLRNKFKNEKVIPAQPARILPKNKKSKKIADNSNDFREKLVENLKGSRFRFINELLYTRKGEDAIRIFKEDEDAFQTYHDGYRKQVEQWPINPLDRIIKSIKSLPKTYVVADFGCGEGRLAQSIPNKCYSLDLVAARSDIIACDMAHTPLPTESINVVVFCLSLMGTNLRDFLLEANRVLKISGHLKIAEVESRFDNIKKFVENVQRCGFELISQDISTKIFYFLNFRKTRNIEKLSDMPTFSLKPCVYKKR